MQFHTGASKNAPLPRKAPPVLAVAMETIVASAALFVMGAVGGCSRWRARY
jgi:hypothetical protein